MINLAVYEPDSDEEIPEEHEALRDMLLRGLHGGIEGLLRHNLGELVRQIQSESDSGDDISSVSSASTASSSDNEGGVIILHFYKIT